MLGLATMSEIYCIYSGEKNKDGLTYGGTVNMKTRQGYAMIAFVSAGLAHAFLAMIVMRDQIVLPVAQLGEDSHPFMPNPEGPLPNPCLKIVFPSRDVLESWRDDKEGFDTAPYVSELNTEKA